MGEPGTLTLVNRANDDHMTKLWQTALALLAVLVLFGGCSAFQGATSWEPLPLRELAREAESATPAEWNATPPERWPDIIPAPTFFDDPMGATVSGEGYVSIQIRSGRLDESDVVAYMALLLSEGFVPDTKAASDGWFVRDGFEWIHMGNLPTSDYLKAGDFGARDPLSGGFIVGWTTDPTRIVGYR